MSLDTNHKTTTLRKVNAIKNHMDNSMKGKLCLLYVIQSVKSYSMLLIEVHPFYDGNNRTCKILFANDDKVKKLIYGLKD